MKTLKRIFAVLLTVCMLFALSAAAVGAEMGDGRLRAANGVGTITVGNAIEGAEYKAYRMLALHEYAAGDTEYVYVVTDEWKDFFVNPSATGTDKTANNLKDFFIVEEFANDPGMYYVTWVEVPNETEAAKQARMERFAAIVEAYVLDNEALTPTGTAIGEKDLYGNVNALIQNLPMGYYFINTNGGSAVIIDTFVPDATVEEKNTVPTIDKRVLSERGEEYTDETATPDDDWHKSNTASIGDTVKFKTTITAGTGAVGYTLHDAMSEGLTFSGVNSVKVTLYIEIVTGEDDDGNPIYGTASIELTKKNDVIEGAVWHYVVNTTDLCTDNTITAGSEKEACDFEIVFNDDLFSKDYVFTNGSYYTIKEGDQLVVEYTAVLNENAVINGAGNPNRTVLTYSNVTEGETQPSTPQDETVTYSYKFDLVKTDRKDIVLEGAEFMLHTADIAEGNRTENNAVKLVTVSENPLVYRVATAEEIANPDITKTTTITAGAPIINGLGNGYYYLTETLAPEGYKKLSKPVEFEIKSANIAATLSTETDPDTSESTTTLQNGGVQIINAKKSLFPSTGGIGTFIFYVVGGLLVVIAGIFVAMSVKKRRIKESSENEAKEASEPGEE